MSVKKRNLCKQGICLNCHAAWKESADSGIRFCPHCGRDVKPLREYAFRRFFARMLDIFLCEILLTVIFCIFNPKMPWMFLLIPVGAFLLDSAVYCCAGNTLGKRFFRIKVTDRHGILLNRLEYLWRNLTVLLFGYGCGLPVWCQLQLLYQLVNISVKKCGTSYDSKSGNLVLCQPVSVMRYAWGIILCGIAGSVAIMSRFFFLERAI